MHYFNVIASFFIALCALGLLPMVAIFAGGGMVSNSGVKVWQADAIMWLGILLGIASMELNIWGQIKYSKIEDGGSTMMALLMMYSSIPFMVIVFGFVFLAVPTGR